MSPIIKSDLINCVILLWRGSVPIHEPLTHWCSISHQLGLLIGYLRFDLIQWIFSGSPHSGCQGYPMIINLNVRGQFASVTVKKAVHHVSFYKKKKKKRINVICLAAIHIHLILTHSYTDMFKHMFDLRDEKNWARPRYLYGRYNVNIFHSWCFSVFLPLFALCDH